MEYYLKIALEFIFGIFEIVVHLIIIWSMQLIKLLSYYQALWTRRGGWHLYDNKADVVTS